MPVRVTDIIRLTGILAFAVTVAGCATLGAGAALDDRRETIREAGLTARTVDAAAFRLFTLERGIGTGPGPLVVYVEGDGAAWRSSHRVSDDPTPRHPIALELALRDRAPALLYVARPCQFVSGRDREGCDARYWSSARYSARVVDAIEAAVVNALRRHGRSSRFAVVGYSGGGTVATLLAARLPKRVAWLVTVAANLDHAAWTALHGLAPLGESLNAVDFAQRLRDVPQLHLLGQDDEVVPPALLDAFRQRIAGAATRAEYRVIPGQDHRCCWARRWPEPVCRFLTRRRLTGAEACESAAVLLK